jgi:hypothetical protein
MKTDESTLDILKEKATSLLSTLQRPVLGSKQIPIPRVPKAFSQEIKWLGLNIQSRLRMNEI